MDDILQTKTFTIGTVYRVLLEDGFEFLPCVPVPGESHTCTRIPKNELITCTGTSEFGDSECIEFLTPEGRVFVGYETASQSMSKIGFRKTGSRR